MSITEFLEARIAEDEAVARACNPAPWFYNGYSAIFSGPMMKPHSNWEDQAFADGHSLEKRGGCKACDKDQCELWPTDYKMDSVVAGVAAQYGDTATGRRMADADHIARHDPARVLAECAAKREIVEGMLGLERGMEVLLDPWASATYKHTMQWFIRPFAAVYKDHPDYQQDWA